jgi:hypothetical protein
MGVSSALYHGDSLRYLDEFRAYYEIYPIVMVLIAHSIASYFGWVKEQEEEGALAAETKPAVEGPGEIS